MVQLRRRLARFIRERRGDLPQREFARKTGLAQSTIQRIENQEQNVTLDTLDQLCRTFHVEVGELFPVIHSPRIYPELRTGRSAELVHEEAPGNGGASAAGRKSGKGPRR